MKKRIIVLYNKSNSGKSTIFKNVDELISKKYKDCKNTTLHNNYDICKIYNINGISVGIESQGDPGSRLNESLKCFNEKKCDIIICTSRTKGETVNSIVAYEKFGYEILWFSNITSKTQTTTSNLNKLTAKFIIDILDNLLSNKL